jgi:hypothetical protein
MLSYRDEITSTNRNRIAAGNQFFYWHGDTKGFKFSTNQLDEFLTSLKLYSLLPELNLLYNTKICFTKRMKSLKRKNRSSIIHCSLISPKYLENFIIILRLR